MVISFAFFGEAKGYIARGIFSFLGIVFGGFAGFALISWIADQYTDNYRSVQRAKHYTREIRLAEIIAGMSPDQMRAYMQYIPTTVFAVENRAKKKLIRTPWGEIPHEFVEVFLRRGSGDYLCPVNGDYWTMQDERDMATWLTNLICANGYANWWHGHYSAKWVDDGYARFLEDFEIDLPVPEEEPKEEGTTE